MSEVNRSVVLYDDDLTNEQNKKHQDEEPLKGGVGAEAPPSICDTSTFANSSMTDVEDEDNADYFADVDFMFAGGDNQLSTKRETLEWKLPGGKTITVALHVSSPDKEEASGHSLWPAGRMLAEYLVSSYYGQPNDRYNDIRCLVELGAGCGLASLTALQLWKDTLQCVVVTDQDTGVLVRACDNLETTLQHIVDSVEDKSDDGELNMAINGIASIPVHFESLKWGNSEAICHVQNIIEDHTEPAKLTEYEGNLPPSMASLRNVHHSVMFNAGVDLVLGSDLILDDSSVVEPLLRTAAELMKSTGRFILAQSSAFESVVEDEVDRMCRDLSLQRTVLFESDTGSASILQFTSMSRVDQVLKC